MKHLIPRLKIGDVVKARVEEVQPGGYLVMNFSGDLIRVKNAVNSQILQGDVIPLTVVGIDPLQFHIQFINGSARFERFA